MSQNANVLNNIDNELINEYKGKSIKHNVATKLQFNINIAGTDFDNIGEAIIHAYRCGLAARAPSKIIKDDGGAVNQDELYGILKKSHSVEHKADFLREIAKEWFPMETHSDKKIKTVHIELNELADYLKK